MIISQLLEFDRSGKNNNRIFLGMLEEKHRKGFRYIVQNEVDGGLYCYSLRPHKYVKEGYWAYRDCDIDKKEALPAEIIMFKVYKISWELVKPTLIVDAIKGTY